MAGWHDMTWPWRSRERERERKRGRGEREGKGERERVTRQAGRQAGPCRDAVYRRVIGCIQVGTVGVGVCEDVNACMKS